MNQTDVITIRVSDYTHTREVKRILRRPKTIKTYGASATYGTTDRDYMSLASNTPLSAVNGLLDRLERQDPGPVRVILDISPRGEEYIPEVKRRIRNYAEDLGTTVTFERKQN